MSASTKVFISYSTKDTEISNNICAALENAGFDCWIAPRDIKPGEDWAEAIIDGIDSSDFLVCVLTVNANESVQVKREIERAVSKKVSIIPFKVGAFELSKSMQYFLSSHHWLNVDEKNVNASIKLLIEKLTGKKSSPTSSEIKSTAQKEPLPSKTIEKPVKKRKSATPAIAVILVLIIAFSAYFFFFREENSNTLTEENEIIPSNIIEEKIEPEMSNPPAAEEIAGTESPEKKVIEETLAMPKDLKEGFNMLTDPSTNFENRSRIKDHLLAMFSNGDAQVNVMIDEMLDESLTIQSFLDRLVTLNNVNTEVLSISRDSKGKIEKVFIETDL